MSNKVNPSLLKLIKEYIDLAEKYNHQENNIPVQGTPYKYYGYLLKTSYRLKKSKHNYNINIEVIAINEFGFYYKNPDSKSIYAYYKKWDSFEIEQYTEDFKAMLKTLLMCLKKTNNKGINQDPRYLKYGPITERSEEHSGDACNYYRVFVRTPFSDDQKPYIAECGDIIEELEMNQDEANEFKEIWRTAAHRTLNKGKKDNNILRAAQKRFFFAKRALIKAERDSNNKEK